MTDKLPSKKDAEARQRERRLAEALRANLKRRKAPKPAPKDTDK